MLSELPVACSETPWASPYATRYRVDFGVGKRALDLDAGPQGEWKPFPSGVVKSSQGGTVSLKLIDAPVSTQYVRVLMTESSNISEQHLVPARNKDGSRPKLL
jgi:hypothetical protein